MSHQPSQENRYGGADRSNKDAYGARKTQNPRRESLASHIGDLRDGVGVDCNAGWNCGSIATTDGKGRPIWVVAAERCDAGRFVVHTNQEVPAFLELESAIQTDRHSHEFDCPEPDEELGNRR